MDGKQVAIWVQLKAFFDMNISFEKLTIEITEYEARDIYSALKRGLEHTIEEHWKNYPDSFERNESSRLHMMTTLGRALGYEPSYDIAQLKKQLADAVTKIKVS